MKNQQNKHRLLKNTLKDLRKKLLLQDFRISPNALTLKTIKDAHEGKGIYGPVEYIRSFINSI
jgi:hypothetical protein